MRTLRNFLVICGILALSACFYSDTNLIEDGEGAALPHDTLQLCGKADDCLLAERQGATDIYIIDVSDSDLGGIETVPARFAPIMGKGGQTVYLGEYKLSDEGEHRWFYALIKADPQAGEEVATYKIALLDADDFMDVYNLPDGFDRPEKSDVRVKDLDALKAIAREALKDEDRAQEIWGD